MLYASLLFNQLSPVFTSCLSASPTYMVLLGLIDLVSFKLQLSMKKKQRQTITGKSRPDKGILKGYSLLLRENLNRISWREGLGD